MVVEALEFFGLGVRGVEGEDFAHLGVGLLELVFLLQRGGQLDAAVREAGERVGILFFDILDAPQQLDVADGLLVELGGGGEIFLLL